MVKVFSEGARTREDLVRASKRPVFLSFVNRELLFLRKGQLNENQMIHRMKVCALMTTGPILVPFAQVSEMFFRKPKVSRLVEELAGSGKLEMLNQHGEVASFVDSRRQMYSSLKSKYEMYFSKKPNFGGLYRSEPRLNTTEFVKDNIVKAANGGTIGNLISADECRRLEMNSDYVNRNFRDKEVAATFSIYRHSTIEPKPAEVEFFGRISTRLFVNHYSSQLDAVAPTGYWNDPLIEDFDYYPLFDVLISSCLFDLLGLAGSTRDPDFHNPVIQLISSEGFAEFCIERMLTLEALTYSMMRGSGVPPRANSLIERLSEFDFGGSGGRPVNTGAVLARVIQSSSRKFAKTETQFAAVLEALGKQSDPIPVVAVFTATDLEDRVLRNILVARGFKFVTLETYNGATASLYDYRGRISLYHVRSSMGSGGVGASMQVSERMLSAIKPSLVLSVGVCFGLDEEKQKFCDVVVSEIVVPYESGKVVDGGFESRGIPLICCEVVASYCRQANSTDLKHKVFVGPVFSGEKLINDRSFRDNLLKINGKGVGGDMEAAGLATTCTTKRLRFSMIKGICDFAADKADDHQEAAAINATHFALNLIEHLQSSGNLGN